MAIDKVKAYFAQFGMEERIQELAASSATVELTIPELEQYSGFTGWVDVCKGRQG